MQTILELRHLRMLQALRATGSVSRAACLLNLTQSAVSHQIKALEAHYGAPLFARKSVPLGFTLVGQRLLALADATLPQVEAAERDVARLADGSAGQLRIALECHTCFDWLMPAMDAFRARWPEVELDIISGFHADPVALLLTDRADLAIVSESGQDDVGIVLQALFSYEIVAVLGPQHPLSARSHLVATDFAEETLITYPVPDEMLDLVRQVLAPAGIRPARRSCELTVAILQLVASGRGIAALPRWAVADYVARDYVQARPVTGEGLYGKLFAACREETAQRAWLADFVRIMRETCYVSLPGVTLG